MGSTTKVTIKRPAGAVMCLQNAETGEFEGRVETEPKPHEPIFVENPKGGRANVLLVLQDAATGRVEKVVEAKNIVTTSGNQYYAEKSAGQTPAMTFNKGKLTIASSYKSTETNTRTYGDFVLTTFNGTQSFDSGYPKTSDTDTDNTGSGATVVTYRRTYTTSQGNITIKALGVSRFGATTTAAVSLRKLLNYITLSSAQFVTKTSSQTLKAFINHTFLGS